ncbi:MAG TPA: hypothetical protein VK041_03820, partial [Opitutales bacterium]|nr:hypothetical protein [Opitutales bacterium]
MNPQVKKEIRLLFPAWSAALVLVLLPFGWFPRLGSPGAPLGIDFALVAKGVVFILGLLFVAISVFGREIAGGLWQTELSLPVERKAIWKRKFAVAGVGSLAIWLAFWFFGGFSGAHFWRIGIGSFVIGTAVMGTGLLATLLFRQILPAFAFSLLLPALLVPILWPMAKTGFSGMVFGIVVGLIGIGAAMVFYLNHRLYLRAEDLGPWLDGFVIRFPEKSAIRSGKKTGIGSRVLNRPVRSLWLKEIRLQQVNLIGGLVLLLVIAAVELFLAGAERSETGDGLRTAYSLMILLLPVLAGSVAIAEERKPGLFDSQRMLPISAGLQFGVKLVVTIGAASLAVLLSLFALVLVSVLGEFPSSEGALDSAGLAWLLGFRLNVLENRMVLIALYSLVAATVSLLASSLSRNTLGALVLAVVFLGLGGFAAVLVQKFWTGGLLLTMIGMGVAVLVSVVLANRNLRKDVPDARMWIRNIAAIGLVGIFAVGLTGLAHYRVWEGPLQAYHPSETKLGSVEPLLAEGAEIYRMPNSSRWLVHLPDGRLWISESSGKVEAGLLFPEHGEFFAETDWEKVARSGADVAGIRADGSLWRILAEDQGILAIEPLIDGRWLDLAGGMHHLLAVRDDGTIWGWGSTYAFDSAGQKMRRISRPQQIGDETDWVAAHAIDGSSIGIKA